MIRRTYNISGFDCANCAAKTENYLKKQEELESVTLDFAGDKLHIVFKDKEWSVEQILAKIKEVETDPIEISLVGEKKQYVYSIKGFDCANCAKKTEAYLNKHPKIEEAILDFAGDKLFLRFTDSPLSEKEILDIIKEVETDPIELHALENKKEKKRKIFTKDLWILLFRVIFVTAIMVVSHTLLAGHQYFWIVFALYILGIGVILYDITWKVIKHIIHKENPIDEYLLITIAAVGAFLVASLNQNSHEFMDSIMVAALFQLGKVIEGIATNKSKEAISSALDLRVETANLIVNGEVKAVSPESLKIGDLVLVATGELIPVDGVVKEGEGLVDTSSLTGEFVPVLVRDKSEVYSGCLLKSGTITIKVSREYKDSAVSKINELIANSGAKKSKADEFVTKFARWYTPIVFVSAILVGLIGGLISREWSTWAILGLKMLVVACPCAIVISVPMAYFSAVGLASKNGIVVKGTNYLDQLVEMKKLITDKTGTLTKGEFSIVKINATKDEEELLRCLYAAEYLSSHPIARAIVNDKEYDLAYQTSDFLEVAGHGVSIIYKGKKVLAGSAKLLKDEGIIFDEAKENGSVVYCAYDNEYLGYVVLSDEIKEDSKEMVELLKKEGVEVILLTGDKEENAKALAESLGIEKYHSELLPEEKTTYLEKELSNKYKTGFVGDGINDAASIKGADIGFAMGGIGSDAAVESADIVIMTDHPSKIYDSVKIAKIARHTSIFNIVAALSIKISIEIIAFVTNLFGHPEFIPMWLAVLADTGLTVLLVINSLLVLYRKIKHKVVK